MTQKKDKSILVFRFSSLGDIAMTIPVLRHNVLRTQVLNFLFKLTFTKVQKINKGRSERKRLTRKKNKNFKPLTPVHYRYCDVFRRLGYPVDLANHEYPIKPFLEQDSDEQRLLSRNK